MNLKKYLKEGYILSPYCDFDDMETCRYSNLPIIKKQVSEKELASLARHYLDKEIKGLYSKNHIVLLNSTARYHIRPEDVLTRLEETLEEYSLDSRDRLNDWVDFLSTETGNGHYFYPTFKKEFNREYIDDYLFEKDDHIVAYVFSLIKMDNTYGDFRNKLISYITFIKEIITKAKEYSCSTIYLMLEEISYKFFMKIDVSNDCLSFYREKLLSNAEKGDLLSMRLLGYEYYEGNNGFLINPKESEYWLERYFSETKDSEVARTLGYIYYYGRTTKGIPQKEKAFQYFAIGHFAGHYFEATYKLADCYVKGYGTPVCEEAAFNLVASIYAETRRHFLETDDSKYADVALRLGNYYRDGTYVDQNMPIAYEYFLEAKIAIKKRLEVMDYIGDSGVAINISKSLRDVQSMIDLKPRVIDHNGYLIDQIGWNCHNLKYGISADGKNLLLTLSNLDNRYSLINVIPEIGFAEKTKKAKFLFVCEEEPTLLLKTVSKGKITDISLFNDELMVVVKNGKKREFIKTKFKKIIVLPQTINDCSKLYSIVSISPFNNEKLYDYVCENDSVEIGDKVFIEVNGKKKEVEVENLVRLYEDELPLPLQRMGKVYLVTALS